MVNTQLYPCFRKVTELKKKPKTNRKKWKKIPKIACYRCVHIVIKVKLKIAQEEELI